MGGPSIAGVFALFRLGVLARLPSILSGDASARPCKTLGGALFRLAYFAASFISIYSTAALVGARTSG